VPLASNAEVSRNGARSCSRDNRLIVPQRTIFSRSGRCEWLTVVVSLVEVLHERDVDAAGVHLGVQEPSAITRDSQTRPMRDRLLLQGHDMGHPTRAKAEQPEDGLRGLNYLSLLRKRR
jgi:hypothetical protein